MSATLKGLGFWTVCIISCVKTWVFGLLLANLLCARKGKLTRRNGCRSVGELLEEKCRRDFCLEYWLHFKNKEAVEANTQRRKQTLGKMKGIGRSWGKQAWVDQDIRGTTGEQQS